MSGKTVLVLTGLGVAALIVFGLGFTNFYASLGHIEQVRGLVTFLFVLVTVAIILVFALGIFWVDNVDEMTKRLAAAKDLLTVVVGIVGTIMGFYFGSATNESVKMSSSALSPPVIRVGESPTLTGQISGGAKPYKYTVVFANPSGPLTADQAKALNFDGESAEGAISKKMTVPDLKAPATAAYTITSTDSKNAKTTSTGTLYIELKAP